MVTTFLSSVPNDVHIQPSLRGNSHPECLPEMSLHSVSHNIYPQKVPSERSPLEDMASHSQSAPLNQNHRELLFVKFRWLHFYEGFYLYLCLKITLLYCHYVDLRG